MRSIVVIVVNPAKAAIEGKGLSKEVAAYGDSMEIRALAPLVMPKIADFNNVGK